MPKAELKLVTEGDDTPIAKVWVYLKQGDNTTILRTDAQGLAMKLRAGVADTTLPWEYTERYIIDVPVEIELFYSSGARPLPAGILRDHGTAFWRKQLALPTQAPPAQVLVAPNSQYNTVVLRPQVTVRLPQIVLGIITPKELSLWPLLWSPIEDTYYTHGIAQGAVWWAQHTLHEGGAAPAPQHRPRERGLLLTGTIDRRATGARIKIWNVRSARTVKLRRGAIDQSTDGHDEVAAVLRESAEDTAAKSFETALYFLHPDDAFGPLQIIVVSEGISPQPIVGAFTALLVGVQGALVDDGAAALDGTQRGPQRLESHEKLVVDYTRSPTQDAVQHTANIGQRGHGRIRRMIVDEIRATRARQLAHTQSNVVHNEMPLWMAEIHLIGAGQTDLEDLMRRRKRWLDGAVASLAFSYQWHVRLLWRGPDSAFNGFSYDETFSSLWTETGPQNAQQTVTLRLDDKDALRVTGQKADKPFEHVPAALPFPIENRRLPAVFVSDQRRPWGRQDNAAQHDALVLEWQVAIVQGNDEVMRGGDCIPTVVAFQIGGARVHPGVRPNGQLFESATPDIQPPTCRVLGQNAEANAVAAALTAVTQRFYDAHANYVAMRALPSAAWERALRFICTHESSGHQFDPRTSDARYLAEQQRSFGSEKGMPFFGGPHGYGIGQKDPAPPTNAMFNYLEAINVACDELLHTKADAARTALLELKPGLDLTGQQSDRAALLREATRRYNGGREFEAHNHVLYIRPHTSLVHRNYPNDALQTTVPYGDLDPPQSLHHIEWLPQYYGLVP